MKRTKTELKILEVLARGDEYVITSAIQARIALRMAESNLLSIMLPPRSHYFQDYRAVSGDWTKLTREQYRSVNLEKFKRDWQLNAQVEA